MVEPGGQKEADAPPSKECRLAADEQGWIVGRELSGARVRQGAVTEGVKVARPRLDDAEHSGIPEGDVDGPERARRETRDRAIGLLGSQRQVRVRPGNDVA